MHKTAALHYVFTFMCLLSLIVFLVGCGITQNNIVDTTSKVLEEASMHENAEISDQPSPDQSSLGEASISSSLSAPLAASDLKGQPIADVEKAFKEAGFSKVNCIVVEDLTSENSDMDGLVEIVEIDGKSEFNKEDLFPKDCTVDVTYHIIPQCEIPFDETEKQNYEYGELVDLFTAAGFSNITVKTEYDIDPDLFDADFSCDVQIAGSNVFKKGTSIPFDSEIEITYHFPYEKYTVIVSIDFIPNLFFSKYDIDLSINGEQHTTLVHGKDGEFTFRLKAGEYVLAFSNSTSPSVKGETSLSVDCDIDASYKIFCYSDYVKVEEVFVDYKKELSNDEVKIMGTQYDFIGKNYKDVVIALEELGFTNIEAEPVYDIIWGITQPESVSSVTIGGNNNYRHGDIFSKAIEVSIVYHMPYGDDPALKSETPTEEVKQASVDEKEPANYDLDNDLVVICCEQDEQYTTQYYIVFAEYDTTGNTNHSYSFDSYKGIINPRTMGKQFNAIGEFPSWFYVGAIVHVRAHLNLNKISTKGCVVTPAEENKDGLSGAINTDTGLGYLSVSGETVYNAVIADETVSYKDSYGDLEWYTRDADINGISFQVNSMGKSGRVLCVQVMDIMNTGNDALFYKVINTVFSGEDLSITLEWLKNHLGTESSTKIGDANIVLQLTVSNYPILYIVDDEHLNWIM